VGADLDRSDEVRRRLSAQPSEALRQWNNLTANDQTALITYMALRFDLAFAQQFLKEARLRKRLSPGLTVTNSPDYSPAILKSRGYRFKGDPGGIAQWVHPNGSEVWLIPKPKAMPPSPASTPKSGPHPDIEEVRIYIKEYGDEKSDQISRSRELARLKATMNPQQYAALRKQWIEDYERWEAELDEKIKDLESDDNQTLTADELLEKQNEIERLKAVHTEGPGDWFPPNAD